MMNALPSILSISSWNRGSSFSFSAHSSTSFFSIVYAPTDSIIVTPLGECDTRNFDISSPLSVTTKASFDTFSLLISRLMEKDATKSASMPYSASGRALYQGQAHARPVENGPEDGGQEDIRRQRRQIAEQLHEQREQRRPQYGILDEDEPQEFPCQRKQQDIDDRKRESRLDPQHVIKNSRNTGHPSADDFVRRVEHTDCKCHQHHSEDDCDVFL